MKLLIAVFILTYLVLYSSLHYYIYTKVMLLVPANGLPLIIAFAILILLPLLIQFIPHDQTTLAAPLTWISFSWMGFAFLFLVTSAVLDLYGLSVRTADALLGLDLSPLSFSSRTHPVAISMATALAISCFGMFNARAIEVEHVELQSSKLNGLERPFRLVQISDLHLGLMSSESRIRRLTERIKGLKPDLIVSTGDLLDMQPDHLERLAVTLGELNPPHGKYAVTGNHEAYVGIDKSREITNLAGFTLLEQETADIGGMINLVGMDDADVSKFGDAESLPEREILQRNENNSFTILLKHQPVIDKGSVELFDIQLSGHTHGGQVFPFNLLTRLAFPHPTGLSEVGERTWLYISRGTGSWGPQMRFPHPSELTVFDLSGEEKQAAVAVGSL